MSRIIIEKSHPAHNVLAGAGICVSDPTQVLSSDPLTIGFINAMPKPVDPVRDFCTLFARHASHDIRVLDFTPTPELYTTTPEKQALRRPLLALNDLPNHQFDALILTGFGGEEFDFEEIRFWDEIATALDFAKEKDIPMLASCWGSHAVLHHHHGIGKDYVPENKISGVFAQTVVQPNHPLMNGVSQNFTMPVSRYGRSDDNQILRNPALTVLAQSNETGISLATDGRNLCLTGHGEYPVDALKGEYERDLEAGTPYLELPKNVFENDDVAKGLLPISWDKDAGILARNWIDSVAQSAKEKRGYVSQPEKVPALVQAI